MIYKQSPFLLFFLILILTSSCAKQIPKPPLAVSVVVMDEYHDQIIQDPYRNLENTKDSTVINWLRKQENYASNILQNIPNRQQLIDKLAAFDMEKEFVIDDILITKNQMYFYTKTLAKDNIVKLYYRSSLESPEILIYDPSIYSLKQKYHINYFKPDWNGEKVAVSLSKKGEEASEIIIIEVGEKKVMPNVIKNCTPTIGGIQWLSDNSGFIYLHVPIIDPTHPDYWINTRAILYKIGSNPKKLKDVFSKINNPELPLNPEDFPLVFNIDPTDDYVFGWVGGSSAFYDIYIKKEVDLYKENTLWQLLCKQSDKIKKIVVDKDWLLYLTAKDASNFKICRTSLTKPDFDNPEVLVTEKEDRIINDFIWNENTLFFTTKKNGVEAKLYQVQNSIEKEIMLPKPSGTVKIKLVGSDQNRLRVSTSGYLNPIVDYIYDISTKSFKRENLKQNIDYSEFKNLIVEEMEIPSHDGAMVPISIIRNKEIKKNGQNITLFYGYGAYGKTGGASFNSNFLTWVSEGAILVIARVRGGGHKGEEWHKSGYKTTKPNTWKDMIATTEYMIKEGYTTPEKSAIWGSSAGGIMAGRAITDRPDLYKAVILTSPALNMLRCEIQPNGQNSIKEFGTVKIKEEFEALLEMDSYHHIKEKTSYPATFVTGGMKDGRVVIWDPAKFVAKLQAYNTSYNPIIFGIDFEDGHAGMNNNKLERYKKYADVFAFAFWQTGHAAYQPKN
ncbi:prolyl oligopeptidase family serine peptidase [Aquimarina longa]|uniref:prolyl oligopeptidase family serine peptidase n=1 Tax=Aquimarina longa TaxID=1080221 RepID=UPI0009EA4097|nr:prolyl oligopeptidase family serine peptidase [Aquimarina longa]